MIVLNINVPIKIEMTFRNKFNIKFIILFIFKLMIVIVW
jgi:hypothetical protein